MVRSLSPLNYGGHREHPPCHNVLKYRRSCSLAWIFQCWAETSGLSPEHPFCLEVWHPTGCYCHLHLSTSLPSTRSSLPLVYFFTSVPPSLQCFPHSLQFILLSPSVPPTLPFSLPCHSHSQSAMSSCLPEHRSQSLAFFSTATGRADPET